MLLVWIQENLLPTQSPKPYANPQAPETQEMDSLLGILRLNGNDAEKSSMAPAQGWRAQISVAERVHFTLFGIL